MISNVHFPGDHRVVKTGMQRLKKEYLAELFKCVSNTPDIVFTM